MGLGGVLLLVASANVTSLLLARGSVRRCEVALRLALGASRTHIVGQLLGESLLLASTGTAFGMLMAYRSRGRIAAALGQKAGELLASPPVIEPVDVLAAKLAGRSS